MPNHIKDITFGRFGKLIAVSRIRANERGLSVWQFRCDCGSLTERTVTAVQQAERSGKFSSCGCAHHLRTHGLSSTRKKLHWVWTAMRGRCNNPANKDFPNYGGRGIEVCHEWISFAAFSTWADSTGYGNGLTIERVDVNGNYSPSNCTWVPNPRQAQNTRRTRLFTHDGKTQGMRDWADQSGIPYFRLRSRLVNYGWPIEKALAA